MIDTLSAERDATPAAAAAYISWAGRGNNILYAHRDRFDAAVALVRAAPVLMRIERGARGRAMDIIAVLGGEVAYRPVPRADDGPDSDGGWGCIFCDVRIGGISSPVSTVRLAPGAPSQYVTQLDGAARWGPPPSALCLTEADAEALGVRGPHARRDDPVTEAIFGANVIDVG